MKYQFPKEFEFCFFCGKGGDLTPSHFLKKNSIKALNYKYSDINNLAPMCAGCHDRYELYSASERLRFWKEQCSHNQIGRIAERIYNRVKYLLAKGPKVKVWQ
jgi:hypothetical protein